MTIGRIPTDTNKLDGNDESHDYFPGTLNLMVLKTLEAMGRQHGYAIARRIEQVSGCSLNQGTIYAALLRLRQGGWIKSEWGISKSKRRARFYSLSRLGFDRAKREVEKWNRITASVAQFLTSSD